MTITGETSKANWNSDHNRKGGKWKSYALIRLEEEAEAESTSQETPIIDVDRAQLPQLQHTDGHSTQEKTET